MTDSVTLHLPPTQTLALWNWLLIFPPDFQKVRLEMAKSQTNQSGVGVKAYFRWRSEAVGVLTWCCV